MLQQASTPSLDDDHGDRMQQLDLQPLTPTEPEDALPRPRHRRCPLSPEESRRRRLANKKAWADKNRVRVRAQICEIGRRPENVEKRKRLYRAKRDAMLAAGHVPRRPGRPPLVFETEEARSEHARQKRLLYNWRRRQEKKTPLCGAPSALPLCGAPSALAAEAQVEEVVADAAETGSTDT